MRNLLGGKGANLAEMSSIGIPVPPGFTIPTTMCTYYNKQGLYFSAELKQKLTPVKLMEEQTAVSGSVENPQYLFALALVSVCR